MFIRLAGTIILMRFFYGSFFFFGERSTRDIGSNSGAAEGTYYTHTETVKVWSIPINSSTKKLQIFLRYILNLRFLDIIRDTALIQVKMHGKGS